MLPSFGNFIDTTLIAVGLKTNVIELIVVAPTRNYYQRVKALQTSHKPTCLIQLSARHLAVAVGSLQEASNIEIHDISTKKVVSVLKAHTDMIDSLLMFQYGRVQSRNLSPWTQWLLSAGRDGKIILWKLIDGMQVNRCAFPDIPTYEKISVQF